MSYSTADAEHKYWRNSLILRVAAFVVTLVAIIIFVTDPPISIALLLLLLVAFWSLVDGAILLCKRTNHPVLNLLLDHLSFIFLGGVVALAFLGYAVENKHTALAVGVVTIIAAVIHFVLCIRSCMQCLDRRRENKKKGAWKPVKSSV